MSVCGIVVVDKPQGMTSFDVVARVRRIFGERRVGHTGTLDPMATGVLPVCIGEACKLVPFVMADDKAYSTTICFGKATSTYDAEGEVTLTRDASHLTRAIVEAVLPRFVGAILQKPPMHSAIKIDGERLYEKARKGETIDVAARPVVVHAIVCRDVRHEGSLAFVDLDIVCGKGTYIRSIGHDLGALFETGAHLTALRRTRAGSFRLDHAATLDALTPNWPLVTLEAAIAHLPALALTDIEEKAVQNGKRTALQALAGRVPAPSAAGFICLMGPTGRLVAVVTPSAEGRVPGQQQTLDILRVFC